MRDLRPKTLSDRYQLRGRGFDRWNEKPHLITPQVRPLLTLNWPHRILSPSEVSIFTASRVGLGQQDLAVRRGEKKKGKERMQNKKKQQLEELRIYAYLLPAKRNTGRID